MSMETGRPFEQERPVSLAWASIDVNELRWHEAVEAGGLGVGVGAHAAGDEQIVQVHLGQFHLADVPSFIPREDVDAVPGGAS